MDPHAQTVRGPVDVAELGITLMHEHCIVDLSHHLEPSSDPELGSYYDRPVTMDLLGTLRRHPLDICRDNVLLDDAELAVAELELYAAKGGKTVVDCTVIGMGRNPTLLRYISEITGLHVIAGTGLYVDSFHPEWVQRASIDETAERFISDITVGIDGTDIRAGIIGEIGTSGVDQGSRKSEKVGHYTDGEEKALKAAAQAAIETGVAVSLHIDRRAHGAEHVIEVLLSEGLPPHRVVAGHMDICEDIEYDIRVAELGVFVQYDGFGREYYSDNVGVSYPKDVDRIGRVAAMIERGYVNQLTLSEDVSLKMDLVQFGGMGYAHLLKTIVPIFDEIGISRRDVNAMLIDNPKEILTVC